MELNPDELPQGLVPAGMPSMTGLLIEPWCDDTPDYLKEQAPEVNGTILGVMVIPPNLAPMFCAVPEPMLTTVMRQAVPAFADVLGDDLDDFTAAAESTELRRVVYGDKALLYYVRPY